MSKCRKSSSKTAHVHVGKTIFKASYLGPLTRQPAMAGSEEGEAAGLPFHASNGRFSIMFHDTGGDQDYAAM